MPAPESMQRNSSVGITVGAVFLCRSALPPTLRNRAYLDCAASVH